MAVTTERSSAGLARGYLIGARVGSQVVQVQLLGFPNAPLPAVEELARLQVACLQAGACPDRAAPPASLLSIAAATPVGRLATGPCGSGDQRSRPSRPIAPCRG